MRVLDHVTISARDFAASVAFYDAVLGALGLIRLAELVDEEEEEPALEAVGWGRVDEEPLLWLVSSSAPTCGAHVRLRGDSRAAVEAFHAAAMGAGGAGYAPPRRWAVYRRGEFNTIVRDPDGNLIEAVAPE